MMGDYDFNIDPNGGAHDHEMVPVFKVGDFGHGRSLRGKYQRSWYARLRSRVVGNRWCNTPEYVFP